MKCQNAGMYLYLYHENTGLQIFRGAGINCQSTSRVITVENMKTFQFFFFAVTNIELCLVHKLSPLVQFN